MFYSDGKLQYTVRVDAPNPLFARQLQQAIGGVEGEIRAHIYASGNLAADMYANVTAEATGRVLATRLYEMTDDAGMKDMLSFLIARDTMHQQQWLQEQQDVSYAFLTTTIDGDIPEGRWSSDRSWTGTASSGLREPARPVRNRCCPRRRARATPRPSRSRAAPASRRMSAAIGPTSGAAG